MWASNKVKHILLKKLKEAKTIPSFVHLLRQLYLRLQYVYNLDKGEDEDEVQRESLNWKQKIAEVDQWEVSEEWK